MDERRSGGRPPGMTDVARLAGVSHQTVSRVLNDAELVRPATRDRVLAAIEQLGYQRNLAARQLATRESGLIGVVAAGFPHTGPASIVGAVETAARQAGFAVMVAVLGAEPGDDVAEVFASFAARGVEGIVVVAPRTAMAEQAVSAARGVPTVLVADLAGYSDACHVVAVDHVAGARAATRHLLDGGARDVLHVSGPLDWFDAATRRQGWAQELAASGVSIGAAAPGVDSGVDAGVAASGMIEGDWSADTGYTIGRDLVAAGPPEAVFCANDLTAIGLLAAFREGGVRVPHDVAVVGYDDIAAARYVDPPLTTVRQPFERLGARCVEVLLAALDGAEPGRHAIAPDLIVRASTRTPSSGASDNREPRKHAAASPAG